MTDFDFDVEISPAVDYESVANTIAWPLLDYYWRADWRKTSWVGNNYHIEKMGKVGSVVTKAVLSADTNLWVDSDDNGRAIHTVAIEIEEHFREGRDYDYLASRLITASRNPDLLGCFDGSFVAVKGINYSFDSDGELAIGNNVAVLDEANMVVFTELELSAGKHEGRPENEEHCEDGGGQKQVLRVPDLEVINKGLIVLDVPTFIYEAMDSLKAGAGR